MKTWEEMSEHEQLSATHYEMYKDTYGFRPRHIDYDNMSVEEIQADMSRMAEQMKANELDQAAREADAAAAFEARVQQTIEAGAKDRETAIRWLFDAENDPYVLFDPDYYCSLHGLPYGYFKKTA